MDFERIALSAALILACVTGYPSPAAEAAQCGNQDPIQCCLANGGVPSECEKAHPEAVAAAIAAQAKSGSPKPNSSPGIQESAPPDDIEQAKCRPGASSAEAKDCKP